MAISLAAAALLLTGCGNGNGETPVEEVDLAAVTRQVEAFGRISVGEERSVTLAVPVSIEEVSVREGQRVGKNETVLRLDMREVRHQLAEAEGELAIARREVGALEARLDLEAVQLSRDLAFAQKEWQYAREQDEIHQHLHEAGAISEEERSRYRQALEAKEKQMEELQFQLKQPAVAGDLQVRREFVATLEGRLQRLAEQLQHPLLQEDQIVSPFEQGAVMNLEARAGERLEAGQRILRFVDLETLQVEADVLEEFIRDVSVGAPVTLVPAADRSRRYSGRVESISDTAFVVNNETVVPVIISLQNPDELLRPNFNMDVIIEIR